MVLKILKEKMVNPVKTASNSKQRHSSLLKTKAICTLIFLGLIGNENAYYCFGFFFLRNNNITFLEEDYSKEESEKVGLKLNIQKTKIMASGPITSWQIEGETSGNSG